MLGWGLVLGVVAIAGLPPLGIFMSEFLIVSSTFAREPLLAILLVFGLLVAFGALMLRLSEVAFGEPTGSTAPVEASYVPLFAHLALVAGGGHLSAGAAGGLVPERGAAAGLEERPMTFVAALQDEGAGPSTAHRPWPRVVVDADGVAAGDPGHRRRARRRCSACGATARPCTWRCTPKRRAELLVVSLPCPERRFPVRRASRIRRRCGWSAPSATSTGWSPTAAPTRGAGSTTAAGACATRSASARPAPASGDAYAFLTAEGPPLHQIPVGPVHAGIIEPGHFRFTANGETVVRLEERLGYVHKGIDDLMIGAPLEQAAQARRPRFRRQHGRLRHRLRARGGGGARASSRRRARSGCAR